MNTEIDICLTSNMYFILNIEQPKDLTKDGYKKLKLDTDMLPNAC